MNDESDHGPGKVQNSIKQSQEETMKRIMYLIFGLNLLIFMSCQKNSVNDEDELSAWEKENTEEIESVIDADADLTFDAIDDESEENFQTDEPNWLGSESLEKTTATKTRFGRIRTRPVERSIQVIFDSDSTATAYVYTKIEGIFVVAAVNVSEDTITYDRFQKPMVHEVERVVHLKKVRDTAVERRNWKIQDISMKAGASPNNTVEIIKLDVMPAGLDSVEITDPLNYFMNGTNMFIFPRFTEIKLRVTVDNTSADPIVYPENTSATETVLLHYGRNRQGNHARRPFTWVGQDNMGHNIYEGTWTVKQFQGRHHAVIDVIDNGTILNSDEELYPYNSNTWASPYKVTLF
jgi:hypothetical protein